MIKFIYLYLLVVGLSLLLTVPAAYAQEENPDEVAKKHGITFPIAELGNCTNFSECRAFCNSEANKESCISFAKKKGFHKEEQSPKGSNTTLLESAKSELGCDSETACRAICETPENRDKCSSFAQKHGLGGPQGNHGAGVLEKAKEFLGCDSESSCRTVCEQEANREKCSRFASQTGIGGGIKRVGPGGCTSEENCRTYCESHPEECGGGRGPGGRGPGEPGSEGLDMEKLCRENPERCSRERGDKPSERNQRPPEPFDGPENFEQSDRSFEPRPEERRERQKEEFSLDEQPPSSEVRGIETARTIFETIIGWLIAQP